jgi:hypothetical protein
MDGSCISTFCHAGRSATHKGSSASRRNLYRNHRRILSSIYRVEGKAELLLDAPRQNTIHTHMVRELLDRKARMTYILLQLFPLYTIYTQQLNLDWNLSD